MTVVKFMRRSEAAVLPKYKTPGSAGADLYSAEFVDIPPGKVKTVDLGFSVSIPRGYEIQVRPRSGLAAMSRITVLNTPGTVDSDYRGPMKVILANFGDQTYYVSKGDRIAQMVLARVDQAAFDEVEKLDTTERGEGGFGSTGRS